jgi:hypothetical protein
MAVIVQRPAADVPDAVFAEDHRVERDLCSFRAAAAVTI